jgi:hypothetical protein
VISDCGDAETGFDVVPGAVRELSLGCWVGTGGVDACKDSSAWVGVELFGVFSIAIVGLVADFSAWFEETGAGEVPVAAWVCAAGVDAGVAL